MHPAAIPLFGLALVGIGGAFLWRHSRLWAARRSDERLDADERIYHYKQYRRRRRISGLIVLMGLLIPAGDFFFERNQHAPHVKQAFALYWMAVLGLVVLLFVWAAGDLLASAAHGRAALGRARTRRAELEQELEEVRRTLSDGR